MKKIYNIVFLVFISCALYGQGIYNSAYITIQNGVYVNYVDDGVSAAGSADYTNQTGTADGTIDNDGTIALQGDWYNNANAGSVFTTINTTGQSLVTLKGTTQQIIGGSSWTNFENLTIDNSKTLTATANVILNVSSNAVNGILTLTNGVLDLNSKEFIIQNPVPAPGNIVCASGAMIKSETENSYLKWKIIDVASGTFVYPFGYWNTTSAAWYTVPFKFTVTTNGSSSSNGVLTMSTYHTGNDNLPLPSISGVTEIKYKGVDNSANMIDRYYIMNFNNYSIRPKATLDFYYDRTNTSNLFELNSIPESNLQAQRWLGSNWGSVEGSMSTDHVVVSTALFASDNIPWALVNNSYPLPVELLNFSAHCSNDRVLLLWSTASETNNDYFTVEKSKDMQLWETVVNKDGAGNSNAVLYYSAVDKNLYSGLTYYRLKQTDFDGNFSYSQIITTNCDDNNSSFEMIEIRRGQANNEIVFSFITTSNEPYQYAIYDPIGKLIKSNSEKSIEGYNEIHVIVEDISYAIYMIALQNSHNRITKKILLK